MSKITPQIVQGIIASDQASFRNLYDAYFSYLCGLAVSYIHDFDKARELVNDVFLRVWERRVHLKYPPLPYLISGVRNACFNYLRDSKKVSAVSLELFENLPDFYYDEDEVEGIVDAIRDISAKLPKKCGEIFKMHFTEGVDSEEIALRLGISSNTVRVQLKIALDRIREALKRNN